MAATSSGTCSGTGFSSPGASLSVGSSSEKRPYELPMRSFAPCVSGATRMRLLLTYVPFALARSWRTKKPRSKTISAWCRETFGSRRMMSLPGSRPTVNGRCVCNR